MRVTCTSTWSGVAGDMQRIAVEAPARETEVVTKNVKAGARRARGFARATARRHGKNYPQAIQPKMTGETTGEWGNDPAAPGGQGGMSFERGSRNQPAHMDINRSADVQVPLYYDDVTAMVDDLFW